MNNFVKFFVSLGFTLLLSFNIQSQPVSKEKTMPAMVNNSMHPDGFLGFVQGTGKEPKDSQPVGYETMPNFEDFGLGCFLLAGSEEYKLKYLSP